MAAYHANIEAETLKNTHFRHVLFTGNYCQLVVMNLDPGDEIGEEVHDLIDQFFRVESGIGKAVIEGEEKELVDGTALIIPAGTKHNIINTSSEPLKLYTIYSPPNHPDGTIHATRADAIAAEHH